MAMCPYCMVHKRPVFRLCKCFVATELAPPEVLTVVRGVVKDDAVDIPFVVASPLCIAVIQQVELSSKPAARHTPFNFRCDYAASARVAACVSVKKLDEVDITAKMQANSCVADLMPALVLDAVDTDVHGREFKRGFRVRGAFLRPGGA